MNKLYLIAYLNGRSTGYTFSILIVALILFFTDKIPADLVALLVVVALGVSDVLTPQEAFSGFSRSAVITILAIFIIAEALRRSGVTEQVGNILLKVGGKSERRLVVVMRTAVLLVNAACSLMPVQMSRQVSKNGLKMCFHQV